VTNTVVKDFIIHSVYIL